MAKLLQAKFLILRISPLSHLKLAASVIRPHSYETLRQESLRESFVAKKIIHCASSIIARNARGFIKKQHKRIHELDSQFTLHFRLTLIYSKLNI
jgi:hypothetical protein